ncbi:MAG: hypothetical protein KF716_15660 [Anaerolineae bacterium]|nr:hypothetical protein [Anaerolineae bacterium]
MKRFRFALAALVFASAALLAFSLRPVHAHEGRDIGPYAVEFGWQVEPAYVGVYNGLELFVAMKDDESKKVTGAEATLKLEVSFGDKTKSLTFDPAWNDPGHYVTSLIPTRAGDYTFKLTGKIGDTEVNETFVSGGEFSSVEPAGDVLFPDDKADVVTLQAQIDALKADLEALKAKVK